MYQVYIITTPSGYSKIGISSSALRRLGEAQTDNHEKLSLFVVLSVETESHAQMIEASLHSILKPYHQHREWFCLPLDVLQSILTLLKFLNCDIETNHDAKPSYNRLSNATEKAYQWLIDNPNDNDKTVRELAEIIGVGKDSVAKAKKRMASE